MLNTSSPENKAFRHFVIGAGLAALWLSIKDGLVVLIFGVAPWLLIAYIVINIMLGQ